MREILDRWIEEEQGVLRHGGGKNWLTDIEVIQEDLLVAAISPARVLWRPRELWLVDVAQGQVLTRLAFDTLQVGPRITAFPT
jgi:hypothetical protein